MCMKIKIDDLSGIKIKALLEEHLKAMKANTPEGSVHALDLPTLRVPEITFWTAWDDDSLMGCVALLEHNSIQAELKSMRTSANYLRKGVANQLLQHVLNIANQRGYQSISLETGAGDDFIPARTLYASAGFNPCKPFADYVEDPNSVFMALDL